MEVWKIIFLSKWVICRFHVNLPGCTLDHIQTPCWGSVFSDQTKICRSNTETHSLRRYGVSGMSTGIPKPWTTTNPTGADPTLAILKSPKTASFVLERKMFLSVRLIGGFNQPIWKICSSNWKSSPRFRGENKRSLSCHRLEDRLLAEVLGRCVFFLNVKTRTDCRSSCWQTWKN